MILFKRTTRRQRLSSDNLKLRLPILSLLLWVICTFVRVPLVVVYVWAEESAVDKAKYEFGEVEEMVTAGEKICGPY